MKDLRMKAANQFSNIDKFKNVDHFKNYPEYQDILYREFNHRLLKYLRELYITENNPLPFTQGSLLGNQTIQQHVDALNASFQQHIEQKLTFATFNRTIMSKLGKKQARFRTKVAKLINKVIASEQEFETLKITRAQEIKQQQELARIEKRTQCFQSYITSRQDKQYANAPKKLCRDNHYLTKHWYGLDVRKQMARDSIVLFDDAIPNRVVLKKLLTLLERQNFGHCPGYLSESEALLQYHKLTLTPIKYNHDIQTGYPKDIPFPERTGFLNLLINADFQLPYVLHNRICCVSDTPKGGKVDGNYFQQLIYRYTAAHFLPSKNMILDKKSRYIILDGTKTDTGTMDGGIRTDYVHTLMTSPLSTLRKIFIQGEYNNYLSAEAYYSLMKHQTLLQLVGYEFIARRESLRQGRHIYFELCTPEAQIFAGRFYRMTGILRARALKNILEEYRDQFKHFAAWKPYDIPTNLSTTESTLQQYFADSAAEFGYTPIKVFEATSFLAASHPDYTKGGNIHAFSLASDPFAENVVYEGPGSLEGKIGSASSAATTSHPKTPNHNWGNNYLLQASNQYKLQLDPNTKHISLINCASNNSVLQIYSFAEHNKLYVESFNKLRAKIIGNKYQYHENNSIEQLPPIGCSIFSVP